MHVVVLLGCLLFSVFFFTDPATTEIYTLSLHDALPISVPVAGGGRADAGRAGGGWRHRAPRGWAQGPGDRHQRPRARRPRSEEHTSEFQSRPHLVCRLLLEKKKKKKENTRSCETGHVHI